MINDQLTRESMNGVMIDSAIIAYQSAMRKEFDGWYSESGRYTKSIYGMIAIVAQINDGKPSIHIQYRGALSPAIASETHLLYALTDAFSQMWIDRSREYTGTMKVRSLGTYDKVIILPKEWDIRSSDEVEITIRRT